MAVVAPTMATKATDSAQSGENTSENKGVDHQMKVDVVQRSWVNVATRQSLSQFDYQVSTIDGRSVVPVPESVLLDAPPLWEDFLVGRFPSQAPHVAKVHVIVNKIWNLGDRTIKIDAFEINDTMIKFRIRNPIARQRVLRRGMWNICELPMSISKWTPIAEEAQPEIRSLPMWIKIKNVPYSMFSWKGLSFLASPVGSPIHLHRETELVTNFDEAKIFVEVDLTKDLPTRYFFDIQGVEVCVDYEYPWLPARCGICEKWGHAKDACLANINKSSNTVSSPKNVAHKETNSGEKGIMENIRVEEVNLVEGGTMVIDDGERDVSNAVAPGKTEVLPEVAVVAKAVVAENVFETEEGEIVSDNGWITVSPSGRKSHKKSSELIYGQVTLASPSHFDILRDQGETTAQEESGDIAPPNVTSALDCANVPAPQTTPDMAIMNSEQNPEIQHGESKGLEDVVVRASLPRSSKKAHKYLLNVSQKQSQKTKDLAPHGVGKRNQKNQS